MSVESPSDNFVSITVSDTGPGIPADQIENVLKPFHRLGASRATEGSGLGLALVNAIVVRHGGEIELADNRPGLRVTIRFPSMPPVCSNTP